MGLIAAGGARTTFDVSTVDKTNYAMDRSIYQNSIEGISESRHS